MAAAHRRVLARTPAHTPCRNRRTAVSGHVTSAGGRGRADVGHITRRDRGHKVVHRHRLGRRARASVLVCARHRVRGGRCGAHRNARRGRVGAPAVADRSRRRERRALAVTDAGCPRDAHIHRTARGREHPLLTIARTRTVGGIRPHVVCGVRGETRETARERTCTRTVRSVAAVHRRVLARTPAHTSCRNCRTPVVGHVASAGGCGAADIRHIRRCYSGQELANHQTTYRNTYGFCFIASIY